MKIGSKTFHLIFTTISASFTTNIQTVLVLKQVDNFMIHKLQVTDISIIFDFMLSISIRMPIWCFLEIFKGTT